ncbi:speckle targeted PIP5K1A-regulated poly(A) polymerase-like [Saccoglossus kowalevskii]|uniref:Speckle targeted PIP5K1A-regulated poly(A) polymerase n=1 Tax=Saccoglossus kowalevskii TaxID=10224 RepID=A0ABM0N070_SACKO|nr:PREDICTED: speckle targeted PIP5K1A-regulated poly(A) polymerase-like [Saccoglossus kowalevskii]
MMEMEENVYTEQGHGYVCNICHVYLNTDKVLNDHLKGKKHNKLNDMIQYRKRQAERSIYVCGFAKGTSELALIDHFSDYGTVSNVIMDKDKGKYAIIELESKDSVEKILSAEHTIAGHKITIKERQHKEVQYKRTQKKGKSVKDKEKKSIEDLINLIGNESSISDQMANLMSNVRLQSQDVKLRYLICDLLQEIFKEFFPKCLVFPFGSSVNGFGSKGCDLDLHLDLHGSNYKYIFCKIPKEFSDEKELRESVQIEPSTSGEPVLSERQTGEPVVQCTTTLADPDAFDVDNAEPDEIMDLIAKIIKKCAPGCKHVQAITTARCPVVKFIHSESGLSCDISVNNSLAMQNTELLHLYASIDERVQSLVYSLRQWAKYKELAGNASNAGPRLTNYTLTLMVMFYLQQEEFKLIPTVEELKAVTDDSEVTIIDNWDCTFTRHIDKLCYKKTSKTAEKLLAEFFSFYSSFDFEHCMICPRSGKKIPIDSINKEEMKIKVTSICIRDPFELNHNTAMNVSNKLEHKLAEEFSYVTDLYRQDKLNITNSNKLVPQGLGLLLSYKSKVKSTSSDDTEKEYVTKISFHTSPKRLQSSCSDSLEWFQRVTEFLVMIFKDVYLFECEKEDLKSVEKFKEDFTDMVDGAGDGIDVCPPQKKRRTNLDDKNNNPGTSSSISDGDKSEKSDMKTITKMSCSTKYPVWIKRRKFRRVLLQQKCELEGMELEKVISEEITKSSIDQGLEECAFDFSVTCDLDDADKCISMKFECHDKLKDFQTFFQFFNIHFPKMLENY